MNEERRRQLMYELAQAVTKEWADRGQLLEGGWQAYAQTTLFDAHPVQVSEMRKAYFLGAQHVFASLMQVLDTDRKPTEQDLKVVTLIHEELEGFRLSQTRAFSAGASADGG